MTRNNIISRIAKKGQYVPFPAFKPKKYSDDLFLDLSSLADSSADIVELAAANLTASYELNLLNNGRVYGENSFDSAAVSYTSYGKGLVDSAVLLSDNSTLEDLDSVLVAFLDLNVNLNGVTDVYNRSVLLEAAVADKFKCVHEYFPPKIFRHSYPAQVTVLTWTSMPKRFGAADCPFNVSPFKAALISSAQKNANGFSNAI